MARWRSPWLRLWLVCLGLLGPAGGRTVADQLEREVGRSVREALRLQYGFLEDRLLTAWIDRVGQKIARLVPRQDYPYVFYVIDTDAVNALAAPGCFVFVTKGLLDTVRNDDELAGVLAHELGHESERHAWRLIGHELPWIAGGQLLAGHLGDLLSLGFSVAHLLDSLGYSRHLENRADRFGLEYSWRAGYDPEGILSFFETIQPKKKPSKLASYFRTHPPTHERMAAVKRSRWADPNDPANLRHVADHLYANLRLRAARERYRGWAKLAPDDAHPKERLAAIEARWARPAPQPAGPDQAAAAAALRQAVNQATEREQRFGPQFERFRAQVSRVERERSTMRALDTLTLYNPKTTDWQWLTAFAQARELVIRLERALYRATATRSAVRDALAEVRLLASEATTAAAGQEISPIALKQLGTDLASAAELGSAEWTRGLDEAARGLESTEAGMQVMELALLGIADPADWQPRRLSSASFAGLQTALFAARAHADQATVRSSAGYRATVIARLGLAGLRLRLRALKQVGREALVTEVTARRLDRPRELVAFLLEEGRSLDEVVWVLAVAESTERSPFAVLDEHRAGESWPATATRLGASIEAVRLIMDALRYHLEDALPA